MTGHGVFTEGVDIALHYQVADADDGVLHAGGQALAHHLGKDVGIDPQLAEIKPGVVLQAAHPPQAQEEADALGEHGGNGGPRHPPVEHRHKQEIQRHVQRGGDDEVVQRVEAVPQRAHDGHTDIIEDDGEHAAEIDAEIGQGVGQHRFRGVHDQQQAGHQQQPHHRGEHRGDDAEQEVGVDGPDHIFLVLGAVIPGDDHAAADGDAVEKADDQKGEAAAGADGGKGPVVGEIAQHPGIGQIVELLEQLPQKQGEGKGEDTLDDGALGQRRILGP